jgi:hypothetical protein
MELAKKIRKSSPVIPKSRGRHVRPTARKVARVSREKTPKGNEIVAFPSSPHLLCFSRAFAANELLSFLTHHPA